MVITRAAARAAAEEKSRKRRKLQDLSLDDVGGDCLHLILSFVDDLEDLNSFAICSRRCREARSDPSLDQTRTATLICSEKSTGFSIFTTIAEKGWNTARIFGGKQKTHLKVYGLEMWVPPKYVTPSDRKCWVTPISMFCDGFWEEIPFSETSWIALQNLAGGGSVEWSKHSHRVLSSMRSSTAAIS